MANRPPWWVIGLLAFLYIPVIAAFAFSAYLFQDREEMLQRVTQLDWPEGTTQVFLVDEEKPEKNPYYIEAHVRVPTDAVADLLAQPRWNRAPSEVAMNYLLEVDRLPPGLGEPESEELWISQGDATGTNPYTLVLEEQTGHVWMRVDYL